MEQKNDKNAQNNDERRVTQDHIETLQKLKAKSEESGRREITEALTVSLELLEAKLQDDPGNDMELSGTPDQMLLELANRVKSDSTTSGDVKRRAAVQYLTRLGKN